MKKIKRRVADDRVRVFKEDAFTLNQLALKEHTSIAWVVNRILRAE